LFDIIDHTYAGIQQSRDTPKLKLREVAEAPYKSPEYQEAVSYAKGATGLLLCIVESI
jgi:hypothetical protein